jgi:hypothetical protein
VIPLYVGASCRSDKTHFLYIYAFSNYFSTAESVAISTGDEEFYAYLGVVCCDPDRRCANSTSAATGRVPNHTRLRGFASGSTQAALAKSKIASRKRLTLLRLDALVINRSPFGTWKATRGSTHSEIRYR